MKQYSTTALALACIVLVISLVLMERGDKAQHENDAAMITDISNRLDSAQTQIAFCAGTMLTLSNRLDVYQSASLTLSNLLTAAGATIDFDTGQITNLNRQVAELKSENQTLQTTLDQHAVDLTNQMAGLTGQLVLTETNLEQANKNYALLENRLRRDVAERVVLERKFYNLSELQAQVERLKNNPGGEVSAGSIYAGLDVEVKSNAVHVIAPD